jgi:hypothetical protein
MIGFHPCLGSNMLVIGNQEDYVLCPVMFIFNFNKERSWKISKNLPEKKVKKKSKQEAEGIQGFNFNLRGFQFFKFK